MALAIIATNHWMYKSIVMFANRRYSLTRLGFGLNVALQIMKLIISAMLSQEKKVKERCTAMWLVQYLLEAWTLL